MTWLENFLAHPKTTIAGVWGGGFVLAAIAYVTYQAHCDFSLLSWQSAVAALMPVLAGGVMKDH